MPLVRSGESVAIYTDHSLTTLLTRSAKYTLHCVHCAKCTKCTLQCDFSLTTLSTNSCKVCAHCKKHIVQCEPNSTLQLLYTDHTMYIENYAMTTLCILLHIVLTTLCAMSIALCTFYFAKTTAWILNIMALRPHCVYT